MLKKKRKSLVYKTGYLLGTFKKLCKNPTMTLSEVKRSLGATLWNRIFKDRRRNPKMVLEIIYETDKDLWSRKNEAFNSLASYLNDAWYEYRTFDVTEAQLKRIAKNPSKRNAPYKYIGYLPVRGKLQPFIGANTKQEIKEWAKQVVKPEAQNNLVIKINRLFSQGKSNPSMGAARNCSKKRANPSITKEFKGYKTGASKSLPASDFVKNGKLDQLGQLKSIVIETRNTKYLPDGHVTGGKTYVFNPSKSFVAAESRNQLALVGEGVKHLGGKLRKNSSVKGKVVPIGKIAQITYIVGKSHIENPKGLPRGVRINYYHQFGENSRHEQGVRNPKMPMLYLDHDGMPVIREGGYKITANGIEN